MDDAGFVGGLDAGGDLDGQFEGFIQRDRAAVEAFGEGLAFDVLEDEVPGSGLFLDALDAGEVDVAERGKGLGLTLEAFEADGVLGEELRQFLDGDVAVEARVAGQVDNTHAAAADFADELVGADLVGHGASCPGLGCGVC